MQCQLNVPDLGIPVLAQDGPKMARDGPRWPQKAPRWPQDGLRMSQDGPRWPQKAPRWPRDGPRWLQDGPKMDPRQALEAFRSSPWVHKAERRPSFALALLSLFISFAFFCLPMFLFSSNGEAAGSYKERGVQLQHILEPALQAPIVCSSRSISVDYRPALRNHQLH